MRLLHRGRCRLGPVGQPVARALQEEDARQRGIAHQVAHRELERLAHHAVDHQLVLVGIDVGDAGVMALEEQPVGRDDAELMLQRRHAPVRPVLPVDQHVGAPPPDMRLELRRRAVGLGVDDAAHGLGRRRDLQALRPGGADPGRGRDRGAGQRRAAAQEPAPCLQLRGTRVHDVVSCRHVARPWASRHVRLLHDGVLPASHGAVVVVFAHNTASWRALANPRLRATLCYSCQRQHGQAYGRQTKTAKQIGLCGKRARLLSA